MSNLKYPKGSYLWETYYLQLEPYHNRGQQLYVVKQILSSGPKWVTYANKSGSYRRRKNYADIIALFTAFGDPVYDTTV